MKHWLTNLQHLHNNVECQKDGLGEISPKTSACTLTHLNDNVYNVNNIQYMGVQLFSIERVLDISLSTFPSHLPVVLSSGLP